MHILSLSFAKNVAFLCVISFIGFTYTSFEWELVLVTVSLAVTKHQPKSKLWRKVLIKLILLHCYSSTNGIMTGTQMGKNLKLVADENAMEECCLLSCCLSFAQSALL